MKRMASPGTLENFFAKVEKTPECWLWLGGKARNGYGRYYEGKLPDGRVKITSAHRWLYIQINGPLPEELVLDHSCRVRHCVNPAHLEPVTIAENTRRGFDARGHARTSTGLRHILSSEEDFTRWTFKTAKHINVVDGCWLWRGNKDRDGYGRVGVPQPGGKYRTVRAHRWFYEQFVGEKIPKGMVLDHTCRTRLCCNPDHLRLLTHAERVSLNWQEKRETRTTCKNGHVLAEVGTDKNGNCRQCGRDRVARHRAKNPLTPEQKAERARLERERRARKSA